MLPLSFVCAFSQSLHLSALHFLRRLRTGRALLRHAQRVLAASLKRHRPHVSRASLHSRKLSLLSHSKALYSSSFSAVFFQSHLYSQNLITTSLTLAPQTLTTLHNLTASLFGVGAGVLGLESYHGFLFYLFFSLLTSALVYAFRVRPGIIQSPNASGTPAGMERYFRGSMEFWTGGLVEGLSGFVLTWTLFYGLVRA